MVAAMFGFRNSAAAGLVSTIRNLSMNRLLALVLVGVAMVMIVSDAAKAAEETRLQGAGATFPAPLYERWVAEFNKIEPSIKVSYQSIGSGGGIKAITDKTVAFGASDAPLSKKELEKMGDAANVLEFPATAGGVVPAYNLPDVKGAVNFTGEVLAKIFMGKITKWNDPALVAINKDVKLPDLAITPAYRTDSSGTTYVWTSYLATQSDDYKGSIGAGKSVQWPLGQGGKGNEGVAAVVQQTIGSIGYIEAVYAYANKMNAGAVQNKAGEFVTAGPNSIGAATAAALPLMKDGKLTADLWNLDGNGVYPVSAFTYIIVYRDMNNLKTAGEAEALKKFFTWALTDGQEISASMNYAPLSAEVRTSALKEISSLSKQ
jgi:phosphate transport system substrate-binding protein